MRTPQVRAAGAISSAASLVALGDLWDGFIFIFNSYFGSGALPSYEISDTPVSLCPVLGRPSISGSLVDLGAVTRVVGPAHRARVGADPAREPRAEGGEGRGIAEGGSGAEASAGSLVPLPRESARLLLLFKPWAEMLRNVALRFYTERPCCSDSCGLEMLGLGGHFSNQRI